MNKSILELLPPPELHAGLLGPVNQTFTILAKTVPGLTDFMKENNIKGSGCGGDLTNNQKTSAEPQKPAHKPGDTVQKCFRRSPSLHRAS